MIFQNIHTQSSFSKQHNLTASKAVLTMPKKEGKKMQTGIKTYLSVRIFCISWIIPCYLLEYSEKGGKKEYLAPISWSLKIQFLLLITNMTKIYSPATSAPFRFLHFKVTLLFSPKLFQNKRLCLYHYTACNWARTLRLQWQWHIFRWNYIRRCLDSDSGGVGSLPGTITEQYGCGQKKALLFNTFILLSFISPFCSSFLHHL